MIHGGRFKSLFITMHCYRKATHVEKHSNRLTWEVKVDFVHTRFSTSNVFHTDMMERMRLLAADAFRCSNS